MTFFEVMVDFRWKLFYDQFYIILISFIYFITIFWFDQLLTSKPLLASKKAKIKILTYNRFTVLNKYCFYGPKIFKMDKNLNFSKLNLARSKKFSEQLDMIILHDIFHFEGYWSIFQSLICKLKPIFDACQMIIFWSLLEAALRSKVGQLKKWL